MVGGIDVEWVGMYCYGLGWEGWLVWRSFWMVMYNYRSFGRKMYGNGRNLICTSSNLMRVVYLETPPLFESSYSRW